jgi:ribulose bisphosphate carboxylase small subunit
MLPGNHYSLGQGYELVAEHTSACAPRTSIFLDANSAFNKG